MSLFRATITKILNSEAVEDKELSSRDRASHLS